jgi:PST family polysaccharide transporter
MGGETGGGPFQVSRAGLGARTAQGVLVSGLGTAARFAIGLVSASLLARLLTPGDYGTYEIVGAVAGVLVGVKSLGLAEATIQREEIGQAQVSGLFWLNGLLGLLLFCVMGLIGPVLALVYDNPQLAWLNLFVGTTFLLSGLRVQHAALLARQQRFGRLIVADVVSLLLGLGGALLAAVAQWGPWALAIQAVLSALASVVIVWLVLKWRPSSGLERGIGLRPLVTFGGFVTASRLIAVLSLRLDKLLLGLFVLAGTLGQYGRAAYLAALFQSFVVGPLEMPIRSYLSRVWADSPAQAAKQYFRYLRLLVAFPLLAGLLVSLIAPEVVRILFGPQWEEAGQLLSILAVGGAIRILHSAVFTPFISFGGGTQLFRWSLWMLLIFSVLYIVAAPMGATAMSISFLVSSGVIVSSGIYRAVREFKLEAEVKDSENLRVVVLCVTVYIIGLGTRFCLSSIAPAFSQHRILFSITVLLVPILVYTLLIFRTSKSVVADAAHIIKTWLRFPVWSVDQDE